jgi:hypothetical protein
MPPRKGKDKVFDEYLRNLGLEEKKRKKKHVILGEALNRRME